jgi:DNA polymerase-1
VSGLRHLFLIDGSGFIFRAFHALPPLTRPDGTPVGAVYGFTQMILKLLEDTDADAVAVVFDAGRKTFRNKMYPDYKANRPPPPDDLIPQFALVREATRAFNLPALELPGFEADDLIATYARLAAEAGAKVTIVSADKDLMQIVGKRVVMMDPIKARRIGPEEVRERFGVAPEKVVEVQALAGDATDNIPGVPGIGVKTAAELITAYGDLESVLAHVDEIKQPKRREALKENVDKARLSRELVRLRDDVPVPVPLEALSVRKPEPEVLLAFLRDQDFKSILARMEAKLAAAAAAPKGARRAKAPPPAPRYELVQTAEDLEDWIARARTAGVVAVDTETTSLDAMRAELVGVSLCVVPGHACYVPLAHKEPGGQEGLDLPPPAKASAEPSAGAEKKPRTALKQIPLEEALAQLKPLLEDESVLKVGHNIKYDMLVLSRLGIDVAPVDDTMVLSYVLEGAKHGHGMDELAQLYLGHKTITFAEVAGTGKAQVTFDLVPLDRARDYAAEDADVTLRFHHVLKPRLVEDGMATVYETMERPLIPVLVAMERAGVLVDREALKALSRDFAHRLATFEAEIYRLAGHEFTVGSPKQLGEVLFEEMGLPGGRRGKTGAYATGADILEQLAAQGHELPARVLDWRQLQKLKSTYADALVDQINPETGRVHTSYAMAATSTGRLASSEPNLQNIPIRTEEGRKIRRAFVAETGCTLLSVDYSQIELRLAAHVADVEPLKRAFREGADIHALTASQVFGVAIDKIDPLLRRRAKAINFGIIYGISPFGLAQQLGITNGEAAAYIEAYFKRYPGIRDYMERTKDFCRQRGYVETLFGRRLFVPGINDRNPARRSFAERAAINAPLQGAAADIIKRAMVRMDAALAKQNLRARMLLQVHDELVFEVPEAEVELTAAVVRAVMEDANLPAVPLDVPLVAESGVGPNWADAH